MIETKQSPLERYRSFCGAMNWEQAFNKAAEVETRYKAMVEGSPARQQLYNISQQLLEFASLLEQETIEKSKTSVV